MTPVPRLATPRLVLDGHRPDDLDALAAMWADPAVYRGAGGRARPREEVWIRLLRSIGTWAVFGYGSWVVRHRDDGEAIGEVGLIEARREIAPPLALPEMGWTLASQAHGRGLAREALDAVLAWCDAGRIARTTCIIDPDNAASLRLAERVSYRVVRDARYHDRPIRVLER
jgi:RimJ/RimL family protein N-acetyltransferase